MSLKSAVNKEKEQEKVEPKLLKIFHIKVPIKKELMKGVVLGLGSKPAIGTFLSFVGYRHVAIELLQTLSHSTRAYLIKEDGLRGFVQRMDFVKILKDAEKNGKLEEVKKLQVIDFNEIEKGIAGL